MVFLAAAEILTIFTGIILLIWRLQFIFPEFGFILLGILVLTVPLTFFGGVILTRVFIRHRNLVPLALAQAVIGTLTSITIPPCWHHGLRVGPGYYQ